MFLFNIGVPTILGDESTSSHELMAAPQLDLDTQSFLQFACSFCYHARLIFNRLLLRLR